MKINQEQLRIFQAVMQTGSFSAAARKLGKVPSAVSMAISNLEIDLNLTLFQRIGREPTPTAQALSLYEKTEQLLIEMNAWKQHAYALSQGLESELNIVVVSELIHTNWTDYIALLAQQFPDLQINIFSAPQEDANQMLQTGQAQLALMFEREYLQGNEQFVELKQAHLVPVAAKSYPLAKKTSVSFEEIRNSRQIVIASRNSHLKPELLFSQYYWRTDNHHSACTLVLKNLGWGVLPLEMLNENPDLASQLHILNFSDFTPQFEYYVDLVWNRESQLGAAAHFLINHIQKQRKKADFD